MSAGWKDGSTGRWRKLRALVLERDNHRCRLQLPGCLGTANQVHHTLGIAVSGKECSPDLLVSACRPCNNAIGEPKSDPPAKIRTKW